MCTDNVITYYELASVMEQAQIIQAEFERIQIAFGRELAKPNLSIEIYHYFKNESVAVAERRTSTCINLSFEGYYTKYKNGYIKDYSQEIYNILLGWWSNPNLRLVCRWKNEEMPIGYTIVL